MSTGQRRGITGHNLPDPPGVYALVKTVEGGFYGVIAAGPWSMVRGERDRAEQIKRENIEAGRYAWSDIQYQIVKVGDES